MVHWKKQFNSWARITGVTIACASLVSCSSKLLTTRTADSDAFGLAYHLPKSLVKVTIQAYGIPIGVSVASLSAQENEVIKRNTSGAVISRVFIDGRPRKALVNSSGNLTRPLVTELRFKIEEASRVADPEFAYTLEYKPNSFSAERLCAEVNDLNLLTSVQAYSVDQTAQIAIALGKLFGRVSPASTFSNTFDKIDNRVIERIIDPFKVDDLRAIDSAIRSNFPEIAGRYSFKLLEGDQYGKPTYREECTAGSVCYRTLAPVRFGLLDNSFRGTGKKYIQKQTATVINLSKVGVIDVNRAFLTKKLTKLKFNEGVLDEIIIKKPSEALAATKLPLDVYDAILTSALAAPGDFIKAIKPTIGEPEAATIIQTQADALEEIGKLATALAKSEDDFGEAPKPETNDSFKQVCDVDIPQGT